MTTNLKLSYLFAVHIRQSLAYTVNRTNSELAADKSHVLLPSAISLHIFSIHYRHVRK